MEFALATIHNQSSLQLYELCHNDTILVQWSAAMKEKKHSLTLRLDDVEKEKLEKLAEASGLSLAATMRQLIRNAKVKNNI